MSHLRVLPTAAGGQIPRVDYLPTETATWGLVYNKLRGYTSQFAVEQYNNILPLMEKVGNIDNTAWGWWR